MGFATLARRTLGISLLLAAAGCGPAVTIRRLAPAPYNLGTTKTLVLVEASGPSTRERDLVRTRLVESIDAQRVFQIDDAVPPTPDLFDFFETLFSKEKAKEAVKDAQDFRRRHPADVYVRLLVTGVHASRRVKSKTEKNDDGKEVVKRSYWAEGSCSFQLTLVDGRTGERLARFTTSREATSPIYDEWRDSLLETAEKAAVAGAVDEALAQFTPRRVTDRLTLDEKAPLAKEGIELIEKEKLREARLLWEKAAKDGPPSAGLAYNLGCVSEALGDSKAAAEWYDDAIRLDPSERNRRAAADLRQRLADTERLKRRD